MSSDRRAVMVLLLVGVAGAVVRVVSHSTDAPGAVAYQAPSGPSRSSLDSVTARAVRLSRPLRRGEKIDVDVASAEELARLPRVGPGLAARIVADREAHGPFASLEGLSRVSGIGGSLLEAVKPFAGFSARTGQSDGRAVRRLNTVPNDLLRYPNGHLAERGIDRPSARPSGRRPIRSSANPPIRPEGLGGGEGGVSLNTATAEELEQLPGIGPAKARAIVEDRALHGPFRSLDDLARVRGFTSAVIKRLKGRVKLT